MLTYRTARDIPAQFFEQSIKTLLCLLILVLLGAILAGVLQTGRDLLPFFASLLHGEAHGDFRQVLVNALTVLAMVEIFRTAMAYFTEGRVKVTYIIDTVMVGVLTEILAIAFSPNRAESADGL